MTAAITIASIDAFLTDAGQKSKYACFGNVDATSGQDGAYHGRSARHRRGDRVNLCARGRPCRPDRHRRGRSEKGRSPCRPARRTARRARRGGLDPRHRWRDGGRRAGSTSLSTMQASPVLKTARARTIRRMRALKTSAPCTPSISMAFFLAVSTGSAPCGKTPAAFSQDRRRRRRASEFRARNESRLCARMSCRHWAEARRPTAYRCPTPPIANRLFPPTLTL